MVVRRTSQHPAIHWKPGIYYNTGLKHPKFITYITGFYVTVKLLISFYSSRYHQESCTNQDNLQQQ